MGHYASEVDPDWNRTPVSETRFLAVDDPRVQSLARSVFSGFDSGSHLESINSSLAVAVAHAIDDLIKQRILETLGALHG